MVISNSEQYTNACDIVVVADPAKANDQMIKMFLIPTFKNEVKSLNMHFAFGVNRLFLRQWCSKESQTHK